MNTAVLSIAAFVVLIAALAALRIYSKGRFTVEIKEIVAAAFRRKSEHLTPELLTNWIKTGKLEKLSKLPGFVSSDLAVEDSATTS